MMFILGVILGFLAAMLVVFVILCRRAEVEQLYSKMEKKAAGKGYLIEPLSDYEKAQNDVIELNSMKGLDTHLEDIL